MTKPVTRKEMAAELRDMTAALEQTTRALILLSKAAELRDMDRSIRELTKTVVALSRALRTLDRDIAGARLRVARLRRTVAKAEGGR